LARIKGIGAACLLGETKGYIPDPRAAKSVLKVMRGFLRIDIKPSMIDKKIEEARLREKRIRGSELKIKEIVGETIDYKASHIS